MDVLKSQCSCKDLGYNSLALPPKLTYSLSTTDIKYVLNSESTFCCHLVQIIAFCKDGQVWLRYLDHLTNTIVELDAKRWLAKRCVFKYLYTWFILWWNNRQHTIGWHYLNNFRTLVVSAVRCTSKLVILYCAFPKHCLAKKFKTRCCKNKQTLNSLSHFQTIEIDLAAVKERIPNYRN